jgi:hypothetical protein
VSTPVLAAYAWRSNAELIEACARLGYLRSEWRTLDLTYGKGVFWKRWRPDHLTTNDLNPEVPTWNFDFRCTGWNDATFDVVAFDPPYKLNGTSQDAMDGRYGVDDAYVPIPARHQLMLDGLTEAARLVKPRGIVLAKCQDQVSSGRVWWQTDLLTEHGRTVGLNKIDRLDLLVTPRKQPEGRRQVHASRNYSTLLVFKKGA